MQVAELMSMKVETIGRNDALRLAEETMRKKRIRHLPVIENDRLVGVLTQRDIFQAALSSAMGFGEKARTEFLGTVSVKEVMTDDAIVTVGPKESVKRAAELMLEHKIGCLPVVEGERLVGLVTETDLLRVVAERRGGL